ncbi:MraY family glycosyltransferase [Stutzerimonas urumqiensis]|uniref:MraY family glycosyltransferase n=1 Tax=Stutzerimonas urumqiensis TaxID=638269 RepID=UPI000EADE91E|nr:glycosyltransferase family 4 protein [Stutzerimonas urumqiensis]
MSVALLLVGLFIGSFLLVAGLRHYALRRQLVDIPNARSSHVIPTPRGGGLAFVLCSLVALLLLCAWGGLTQAMAMSLLGAAGSVALVGFVDDHRHVPARWRLLGHAAAACWALYWLGGLPAMVVAGHPIELGWLGQILAVLYLVWLINLYNFMDGINGLAAIEGVFVTLSAVVCYVLAGVAEMAEVLIAPEVILATTVAAFLCWNFPQARIFMGDVGSGFLGVFLGILSLRAASLEPTLWWSWLILLGVFIVDATFTLLHRLWRGEAIHQAHRSHAYQAAARRFGSHVPVTLSVLAINVGWLLPWALLVATRQVTEVVGLIASYLPLITFAWLLGAGRPERATS